MDAINLTDLRDHVDELVERIEAGESVDLVRDGKRVATVTPTIVPAVVKEPFDWDALRRLRESMPMSSMTVEEMRRLDLL